MAEERQGAGTARSVKDELEAEVARLVAYINDQVVPEVRRHSSTGLRSAAEQLQRMAEHLDRRTGWAPSGAGAAAAAPNTGSPNAGSHNTGASGTGDPGQAAGAETPAP